MSKIRASPTSKSSGSWLISYTAFSVGGPLVSLATTTDFKSFQRLGPVMPPDDKDAALFPIRFKGRWAMLHRPDADASASGAHIWLSWSPDLKHWGDHHILLRARRGGWWDANKIGLSPPPLCTREGWLLLYHGVRMTASGAHLPSRSRSPRSAKIRPRSSTAPTNGSSSPRKTTSVSATSTRSSSRAAGSSRMVEVRIYYGGADTCIALATANVAELIDWLKITAAQPRRDDV